MAAIRLDATTSSGELEDRTDATMTTERSDGATTTSGDLPRGADATMATVRSDAETGTSRRRGAASIIAATKAGEIDAAPRLRVVTIGEDAPHRLSTLPSSVEPRPQRHHFTNKYSGASK